MTTEHKQNQFFKIGVLALLGFSAYNIAVIAGNTTKSAVVQTAQADYLIQGMQKFSPLAAGVGQLFTNKMIAAAGREAHETAETLKDVAYRDNKGWHYQGKTLTPSEMKLALEEQNVTQIAVQHAQAAHRDRYKTSCADLLKFDAAGVELTPPQVQALATCKRGATVHSGSTTYKGQPDRTVKGYGVTLKITAGGKQLYLDGHPMALDEQAESGDVFSQGFYQVVLYKSGKVALLKNKVVQGYLK